MFGDLDTMLGEVEIWGKEGEEQYMNKQISASLS